MKSLANTLSRLRKFVTGGRASRKPAQVRLGVESLETRDVPSALPVMPTFSLSAVSSSQVKVSWNAASGATNYLVDEWINGSWQTVATTTSSTLTYTVPSLSASTTYYFDLGAKNASGTTWAANFQSITTPAAFTVNHPAATGTYTNVNGSLFGANGPVYTDVQQGAAGDCWLLSSLAEVAVRDPQDIRNMFTYLGTGNENGVTVGLYNVRFFNSAGQATYVTVDTELPSGGGEYDHPANGVLWVSLAEKAYAEANGYRYVTTGSVGSDSYTALNGGDPSWALHAITGKSANSYAINPTNLASAWNAGELIVICTNNPVNQYIVPGHAYAVVGYNPSSANAFTVYNPWGTNSSGWALGNYNGHQVYGQFYASAAFISQNFYTMSFGVGDAVQGQQTNTTTTGTTTVKTTTAPTTVSNANDSVWVFLGTKSNKTGTTVDYLADLLSAN